MRVALAALVVAASLLVGARPAAAHEGFHASFVDQTSWLALGPNGTGAFTIRFRNEGLETWRRGVAGKQVNLGIANDSTAFAELASGWLATNRPATTNESVVPYGSIGSFTFTVRAPARSGVYDVPLRLVVDGREWMEDFGVYVRVVRDDGYHSKWLGQSDNPTLAPGETSADITLRFRNTGGRDWVKGAAGQQLNLGIRNDDPTWASLGVGWLADDRPAAQNEARVKPGEDATFTFRVKAPSASTTYVLSLRPVVDGSAWLEDEGVFVAITVAGGARPAITKSVVVDGLKAPTDLAFAPDGRMFVTERVGNILVYASTQAGAAQLSNTPVVGIRAEGESGLLGVELDPAFATNGYVYLCATRTDEGQWRAQVLRYRMSGNVPVFDTYVIRRGIAASSSHDSCRLRFGPDGKLWVTTGDAGRNTRSQDPNLLNGKVLRVNPDGTIPPDNPSFVDALGVSEVYALGARDPQGLAFERSTGTVVIADPGDGTNDELNVVTVAANFGFPLFRGAVGQEGFTDPVWASGTTTIGVAGADFASGSRWGAWSGSLFVATGKQTDLRRFELFAGQARQTDVLFDGELGRLRAVRLAPDQSLFLTTDTGVVDRVIRVTPQIP